MPSMVRIHPPPPFFCKNSGSPKGLPFLYKKMRGMPDATADGAVRSSADENQRVRRRRRARGVHSTRFLGFSASLRSLKAFFSVVSYRLSVVSCQLSVGFATGRTDERQSNSSRISPKSPKSPKSPTSPTNPYNSVQLRREERFFNRKKLLKNCISLYFVLYYGIIFGSGFRERTLFYEFL